MPTLDLPFFLQPNPRPDDVRVKVSAADARQPFHGCTTEYIQNVCHGRCCENSAAPTGTMITVHPTEEAAILRRGATVVDGILQNAPGCRQCFFKSTEGFCTIHSSGDKPFGCIASPFRLNSNNTLQVSNRYHLLRCFNVEPRLPAYHAFHTSLVLLFGPYVANALRDHLDRGGGDCYAMMLGQAYRILKDNDAHRLRLRGKA